MASHRLTFFSSRLSWSGRRVSRLLLLLLYWGFSWLSLVFFRRLSSHLRPGGSFLNEGRLVAGPH